MVKKKLGRWFADYVRRTQRYCRIGSLLLLPGSVIVSFVTFWIIWWALARGFRPLFSVSNTELSYVSLLMLVILFAWEFLRGSQFEETYCFAKDEDCGGTSISIALGIGFRKLDPGAIHAGILVISLLLLTAPRMIKLALMLHRKAERLGRIDLPLCTRVIGRLVASQRRVSLEELKQNFPEADLDQLVKPLADIDGVVFLSKDDPAMTLAPRFLADFQEWCRRTKRADAD
jgi:hypothetical protein